MPASRKNKKLLDHLTSCTHALMAKFPWAAVILAGVKNDLPLASLLLQSVAQNTHKDKIIDNNQLCPILLSTRSDQSNSPG